MIDYDLWKNNILSGIKNLCDLSYQQETWLGNSTKYCSSFNEDIAMLYSSFGFADDFWNEQYLANFNLNDSIVSELKKLKEMIDKFFAKYDINKSSDLEVISDPEWMRIVDQAKVVVDIWK